MPLRIPILSQKRKTTAKLKRLHYRKPFLRTNLLEVSIGRDLGGAEGIMKSKGAEATVLQYHTMVPPFVITGFEPLARKTL